MLCKSNYHLLSLAYLLYKSASCNVQSPMDVGRGEEGTKAPLAFENSNKKGCFLSFE